VYLHTEAKVHHQTILFCKSYSTVPSVSILYFRGIIYFIYIKSTDQIPLTKEEKHKVHMNWENMKTNGQVIIIKVKILVNKTKL